MEDIDKAATLLMSMGQDKAVEVLQYMNPLQAEKIISAMSGIDQIKKSEVQRIIAKFEQDFVSHQSLEVDEEGVSVINKNNSKNSQCISNAISNEALNKDGFEKLAEQDLETIVTTIKNEHPQVIAVILTYLGSDLTSQVLNAFPTNMHAELITRITMIKNISPTALQGLNWILREKFFSFDKFADIEGNTLRTLLSTIAVEQLFSALKGTDEEKRASILDKMPKEISLLIESKFHKKIPVQISTVIESQKEIIAAAHKIARQEKITLL